MTSVNLNEIYQFLTEVVPKCGRVIRDAFYKEKSLQQKSSFADLVTETDKNVEDLLTKMIKAKYPEHRFIGEETTTEKVVFNDEPVWIIDPVDGTTNFVHKFPYCSLSIGFYIKKQAQIAVVYNPITDELFSAIAGQGAYCNGRTLVPSKQTDLGMSQVLAEFGSAKDEQKVKIVTENMGRIISKVHSIRCLGSAALNMCMVASGAADVYYEFGIHCWDMAAGYLIAKEAGCVVIDPKGGEFDLLKRRCICASTMELAQKLNSLIEVIDFESD